jgi:cytochrome c-type biogenesis protein CcmH/NrfF
MKKTSKALLTLPILVLPVAHLSADEALSLRTVEAIVGPPRQRPLTGEKLDQETQEVAALMRCPVCQGASVADSPASMALNMKAQARELLASGYDREQVLQYFEASYGEFVRLKPTLSGVNWLIWASPIVALILGALMIWAVLRREGSRTDSTPQSSDDLAPYLEKVRHLSSAQKDARTETDSDDEQSEGRS